MATLYVCILSDSNMISLIEFMDPMPIFTRVSALKAVLQSFLSASDVDDSLHEKTR